MSTTTERDLAETPSFSTMTVVLDNLINPILQTQLALFPRGNYLGVLPTLFVGLVQFTMPPTGVAAMDM